MIDESCPWARSDQDFKTSYASALLGKVVLIHPDWSFTRSEVEDLLSHDIDKILKADCGCGLPPQRHFNEGGA